MVLSSACLDDVDLRMPAGSQAAAVHLKVFHPLDVGRPVTGHDTLESHIAARDRRLVSRQTGLQNGPVGGAIYQTTGGSVSTTATTDPVIDSATTSSW